MIGAREHGMHLVWILFLALIGTLAALIAALAVAGLFLPREHRAARVLRLGEASPAQVWNLITDQARAAAWRSNLKATRRLEDHRGREVWEETSRNGQAMSFETLDSIPDARLVRRIVESGGPFGGTWTFELSGEGAGCRIRITEDGWIANPVFRTLARFVFGYHRSLETYLEDLARHFGEPGRPEPAE
jgi:uncharacterized protein YndB with AHSA1/START domain